MVSLTIVLIGLTRATASARKRCGTTTQPEEVRLDVRNVLTELDKERGASGVNLFR